MIVPSIDLMDGKVVQLEQGRRKVLERDGARQLAAQLGRYGEVAVIDLDAALGRGDNRTVVKELCKVAACRVGGGIRSKEAALDWLRSGARSVILGTAASEELLRALPRRSTIVALDSVGGKVATHGWTSTTDDTPLSRARALAPWCGGFLYTAVEREGLLGGADLETAAALRKTVEGSLTVAGGIATAADVRALDAIGADAQIGMALYTGRLDPAEAFVAPLDFERGGGLIPTIVCDADGGRVRMLAYSSPESLKLALRRGVGAYWSRSRKQIWVKGETSGNRQHLVRAVADCDRDALLFFVRQEGVTCHSGAARCFDGAAFSWEDLLARVAARAAAPSDSSYTAKLLAEPQRLNEKILEEAGEVTTASNRAELAWEIADLLYFATVKMRAGGIGIDDVMAQLAARAR